MIPFFVALVAALGFTPLVRWLSLHRGWVVPPQPERWHRRPIPTLGGIGLFAAFALALLVSSLGLGGEHTLWAQWSFLSGAALVFLLGLYDDFRPLTPGAKLVGQMMAAALVIALGYSSAFFTLKLSNPLLAQIPNLILSFLWLVGITNALNLLDNMDGLAGGIALITAAVLAFFFWQDGDRPLLTVTLALAGSVLGFLVFNFPPARLFMGDCGSLFLGFTLAALALAHQKQQASNVLAILGVPTLLFLLPILDTTLVTITRLWRGQSPWRGGRDHTSHRLVAFGLSERQTLAVLYGVALAAGLLAALIESLNYWLSLVLVPLLLLAMALLTAYLAGVRIVAAAGEPRGEHLARWVRGLTWGGRVFEVLLDFLLIPLTYYLAFLLHDGLSFPPERLDLYLRSVPLAIFSAYLAFFVAGVYRSFWRYLGFDDLVRFAQAAASVVVVCAALLYLFESADWLPWSADLPKTVLISFGGWLFLGLSATRASFRFLDRLFQQRNAEGAAAVLIYDAGRNGELALRWLQHHPDLHLRPAGFLDDDPLKIGRLIHGVEVWGTLEHLPRLLSQRPVQGVILACEELTAEQRRALHDLCRSRGCWVRRLRLELEDFTSVSPEPSSTAGAPDQHF